MFNNFLFLLKVVPFMR